MFRFIGIVVVLLLLQQCLAVADGGEEDVGYLSAVNKHFEALVETASTNGAYLARMVAPMSYLAQLSVATQVDAGVAEMTLKASKYLVIASLNPHDGSAYLFDVVAVQGEATHEYYMHQQIEVKPPDGPVVVSRKRALPIDWPLSLLLRKLKGVSGVYIPKPGEGNISYFVTVYDGKTVSQFGALWPIDLGSRDMLSRFLGLGLLVLGLEEEAAGLQSPSQPTSDGGISTSPSQ